MPGLSHVELFLANSLELVNPLGIHAPDRAKIVDPVGIIVAVITGIFMIISAVIFGVLFFQEPSFSYSCGNFANFTQFRDDATLITCHCITTNGTPGVFTGEVLNSTGYAVSINYNPCRDGGMVAVTDERYGDQIYARPLFQPVPGSLDWISELVMFYECQYGACLIKDHYLSTKYGYPNTLATTMITGTLIGPYLPIIGLADAMLAHPQLDCCQFYPTDTWNRLLTFAGLVSGMLAAEIMVARLICLLILKGIRVADAPQRRSMSTFIVMDEKPADPVPVQIV